MTLQHAGEEVEEHKHKAHKSWPEKHKILSSIFVIVILFIILGSIGAASNQKSVNTSTSQASQTTTASNSNTSVATPPETMGDKIASWNSKYGSEFTTLENDLGQISKDADAGNLSASSVDCQQLQSDTATAQSYPAVPDTTVEQHWSSALSDLNAAAKDCVQGVDNDDATLIEQGSNEISQANTQIVDTTHAIEQAIN